MASSTPGAPTTRRERLRRELTDEVVAVARRHLADGGPAAVSWRGIAREVGVNPATLYTYFDSLDDLFTAVILDSFTSLADAVRGAAEAAGGSDPLERVMACANAYRAWAIEHPAEFNLIFTDRIPGYAAPPGGPTVAIQAEIFGPFVDALDALDSLDSLDGGDAAGPRTAERDMAAIADERVALWATMHGFVILEINNHLPFVADPDRVFDQTIRRRTAPDLAATRRSG
jgi:AcrR family transcriptional regulator